MAAKGWEEGDINWTGYKETLGSCGNTLYLACGGAYMAAYSFQNPSNSTFKLEHFVIYKLCCKFYFLNTQPAAHCHLGYRVVKAALLYSGPSRKIRTRLPGPHVVSYCRRGLAPHEPPIEAWTRGRREVSSVLAPPWDPTTLSREWRVLPPKQEAQLVLGGGHQASKEVKEKGRRVLRREDTLVLPAL